ncbi:MAG: hypothetical protein ACLRY8_19830 [Clostridium butyricum]
MVEAFKTLFMEVGIFTTVFYILDLVMDIVKNFKERKRLNRASFLCNKIIEEDNKIIKILNNRRKRELNDK